jgi:hypothetical protein
MPDNATFCPNCGKSRQARQLQYRPVTQNIPFQHSPYASSPPRRDSNLPLVLIAIVAVVIVIVPVLLLTFMIPVITESGASHAIKYTSNDFYNSSSGTMILNESDMGSDWANLSNPTDVPAPTGYMLDDYQVSFNKSSNGGWIDVTVSVFRYGSIYDARDDLWHHRFTMSAFADIKDEDVGDVSYFWTNNITYSLAFIEGNVIVGVRLVNNTPYPIDGEAMIKEIGNKQAEKIVSSW